MGTSFKGKNLLPTRELFLLRAAYYGVGKYFLRIRLLPLNAYNF